MLRLVSDLQQPPIGHASLEGQGIDGDECFPSVRLQHGRHEPLWEEEPRNPKRNWWARAQPRVDHL